MKKHIYALWAFFILFSQSIAASVEVRSTHMTTGDGVANNSIRYIYQDQPFDEIMITSKVEEV